MEPPPSDAPAIGTMPAATAAAAPPERPFAEEVGRPPGRLRIGFSTRSPIDSPVHPQAVAAVEAAARLLGDLGHAVEPAAPELDGAAVARCFLMLYLGQVAADMAAIRRRTGAKDTDFELETRLLGRLGGALSAGEYVTSRRQWNGFARALGRFHASYDLWLLPTNAGPPPRIGALDQPPVRRAALALALRLPVARALLRLGVIDTVARESLAEVPFTQVSNMTGTPSMSVPLHWAAPEPGAAVLPFGVQFVARFGQEAMLLRLAAQLEVAAPWRQRWPALP